jgi:hypothetical protein
MIIGAAALVKGSVAVARADATANKLAPVGAVC